MNLSRRRLGALIATLTFSLTSFAQNFPTKPVRIVIPFAPGGSTDANVPMALGIPAIIIGSGGNMRQITLDFNRQPDIVSELAPGCISGWSVHL